MVVQTLQLVEAESNSTSCFMELQVVMKVHDFGLFSRFFLGLNCQVFDLLICSQRVDPVKVGYDQHPVLCFFTLYSCGGLLIATACFVSRTNLKTHLLRHGGVKPCVYCECPKRFCTASELKSHQHVQLGL